MYCKYCGKQIPDGSKFCPECGKSLSQDIQMNKPEQFVYNAENVSGNQETYKKGKRKKQKSKKKIIFIILMVSVLIIAVVLVIRMLKSEEKYVMTHYIRYDADGSVSTKCDNYYDKEGRLTEDVITYYYGDEKDTVKSEYSYEYWGNGEISKNIKTSADTGQVESIGEYDKKGNLLNRTYYDSDTGNISSKDEYDEQGNLISHTWYSLEDGSIDGQYIREYDKDNRIIYIKDGFGDEFTESFYNYEDKEHGEVTEKNSDGTITATYEVEYKHDKQGHLVSEIYKDIDGNVQSESTYSYDEEGNCIEYEKMYGDGSVCWKYEYDEHDCMIRLELYQDDEFQEWIEYTYEKVGKLSNAIDDSDEDEKLEDVNYEEAEDIKEDNKDETAEIEENDEYKCILTSDTDESERTIGNITFSWESDYDSERGTCGKIYITQNGKTTLFVSETNLMAYIITNGEDVFYSTYDSYYCGATIYRKNINDIIEQILFNVHAEESFSLTGYYDSKLYYVYGINPGYLYEYELETKRQSLVAENVTKVKQNNQYFYLEPYCGDAGTASTLQVYDSTSKKITKISGCLCKMGPVEVAEDAVYYLEFLDEEDYYITPSKVALMRCNADGTDKEILISDLEITSVVSITNNEIVYQDKNNVKQVKEF